MRKDLAVQLTNISKVYKLYDNPIDRLKESLHPLKKKYHKDFYALKNINLEIKKGEVLGIVGVNGAGKSTLLKIISRVLTPTMGRVNVHGRINAILELGSSLKPEMTGRENIKLNLQINGIEKDREKLTHEMIEFADIGEHIDQPVKSYSSGMKARLGFAIATSTDPDVLIVDEVLAVGDVLFRRKCYSKIESLFKDGKTVIFVSHSAQSVIEFCSRAVLLYDRQIILDDVPKKVTDYYQKLVFSKDKQKVLKEVSTNHIEKQYKKQSVTLPKHIIKEEEKPYFIPGFFSKTQIVFDDSKVEITEVKIKTTDGQIVNALVHGQKYIYCYTLKFKEECKNIGFGMSIKNEKGIQITSTGSLHFDTFIPFARENDVYHIEWPFTCLLTTGTYYTNAGTTQTINGEKNILNRVVDACIFKVLPLPYQINGYVSLKQFPKYHLDKRNPS